MMNFGNASEETNNSVNIFLRSITKSSLEINQCLMSIKDVKRHKIKLWLPILDVERHNIKMW